LGFDEKISETYKLPFGQMNRDMLANWIVPIRLIANNWFSNSFHDSRSSFYKWKIYWLTQLMQQDLFLLDKATDLCLHIKIIVGSHSAHGMKLDSILRDVKYTITLKANIQKWIFSISTNNKMFIESYVNHPTDDFLNWSRKINILKSRR